MTATANQLDAVAALKQAMRQGHSAIPVACSHCGFDNNGEMELVNVAHANWAPIPLSAWDAHVAIYLDSAHDPDDEIIECPGCLEYLAPDLVALRQAVIA